MPYLGNEPAVAYTSTTKDSFSGDASTTDFTLSKSANVNAVRVVVENVVQNPTVAYTCSGTTLSFTSAPPTGTNNIYVVHLGPPAATVAPPTTINNPTTFTGGVTLKNETPEDTDGGRKSIVTFQGTQSGSEISTLAQIQASHDGTSDDEKADLIFKTNDGSDGASPTEAMRINSDQQLGIGTSAPLRSLHVSGAGDTGFMLQTTNAVDDKEIWEIQAGADGSNHANLVFRTRVNAGTGGTEAMRITNDGKVGIGTAAPLRQLHIENTSANSEIAFTAATNGVSSLLFGDGQTGTDVYRGYIQYNHANDSLLLATSSTTRFTLNASGNLAVQGVYNDTGSDSPNVVVDGSGNIYRSTSALKYKKDVRDIESIDIDRFRPIRYKSAITKDDDKKDCLGFIADEVHDDGLTELVTYGVNPETEKTEVEGFRYDRMTVILTKVVQEQKATIEAQATQIADLIKRVEALEAG